jgi:molecular chaperone DnaK (HSP70)
MSVVGVDLGNEGVVVAQVNRGGVSIVLNENTGRRTPYVHSSHGVLLSLHMASSSPARHR